jgi:RNA ligase
VRLLKDVLDLDLLYSMRQAGYVGQQEHPTLPYGILNYTHKAQYDRAWNEVTRQCRGIIYHLETQAVLARPWPKFHNYGEHDQVEQSRRFANDANLDVGSRLPELDLDAPVEVTDKLDGSLGILYPTNDGYAIATRGSFTSEQALHGTEIWRSKYADFKPLPGLTYLFEIIYPGNRVVIDYGDMDDLVYLGCNSRMHGWHINDSTWPGPRATTFECRHLRDALAMSPRPNAEGVVVRYLGTRERIKIKQDDYVALHRIVTGLNERTVWEHIGNGGKLDELCEPLPDEFHGWVRAVAEQLVLKAATIESEARYVFNEIIKSISLNGARDWTRKDFAEAARYEETCSYLFLLLDGKDTWPAIWRTIKPSRPKTLVDDVA